MERTAKQFVSSLRFPAWFLILMWAVFVFSRLAGTRLIQWGIFPRETYGIRGIITTPFIHGDIMHLLSNSVPMFILSFMIFFFYRRIAYKVFFSILVLTGLSVWLFGRPVWHIGASGVVYGLVSFVFWSGIFRRNIRSIILALIVTLLYSGLFFGVLPEEGISWESHLMGAVVGILVAYIFKNSLEVEEEESPVYSYESSEEPEQFFLPRNTFGEDSNGRGGGNGGFWTSSNTHEDSRNL